MITLMTDLTHRIERLAETRDEYKAKCLEATRKGKFAEYNVLLKTLCKVEDKLYALQRKLTA